MLYAESLYGTLLSCRKILNELSSDSPAVPKIDEEKSEEEVLVSSAASASVPTSIYQTSSGQYSQYTHGQGAKTKPAVHCVPVNISFPVFSSKERETVSLITCFLSVKCDKWLKIQLYPVAMENMEQPQAQIQARAISTSFVVSVRKKNSIIAAYCHKLGTLF